MSALAVAGVGFGLMGLLPFLTLAVLAWAVIEITHARQAKEVVPVTVERDQSASFREPPAAAALAILDDRFARGEIEGDDYRQRKADLLD